MNNQVIKLRANTNHFGHPVTSHDHPAPPVRQPLSHDSEITVGDGDGVDKEPTGKKNKRQNNQTKGNPVKASSENEKNKDVVFHFKHSSAKKVLLAAEFTEWEKKPITLSVNKDGAWQASVPLAPGRYRYRFIVDGQWQDDPHAREHVSNPYGSSDCVAEVK